jgi:hypothetical protein
MFAHARSDDSDCRADHILWGTDSIWNGSPQGQIARFRRLKMDEELIKKYKYAELTDEIKNQILGLNASKLFGIDPKKAFKAIKTDKLSALKEEYLKKSRPEQHAVWLGMGGRRRTDDTGRRGIATILLTDNVSSMV